MLQLVVMEVGGPQRHDQIAQSDQRRVRVGKEADDDVTVQHRHGRLIAILNENSKEYKNTSLTIAAIIVNLFQLRHKYQYAIFQGASWRPVKHSRRIVFHFRLFEIEIAGLVVGDAGVV